MCSTDGSEVLDGRLALGILIALALNSVLGWWSADAAAAIMVGALVAAEGRQSLRTGRWSAGDVLEVPWDRRDAAHIRVQRP
jgi:divalent metal cation (Fe/Co/Zn/Cd) transporter